MSSEPQRFTVAETRVHLSDTVDRAADHGEITYVTRAHEDDPVAAIVPISWLEDFDALLDENDARIAEERLADIRAGREETIPADVVAKELGL